VRRLLTLSEVPLSVATALVALQLVLQIMAGLNGVIPERDSHAMARTAVELLLLNSLVLAWSVRLRKPV
jgi:hypothetical protein